MTSPMMTRLNAKYVPAKKENAFVNGILLFTSMALFGVMIVYCFFGIICQ